MESIKFINQMVQAVAHKQSEGATKSLRFYKFHELNIVPM